MTYENVIVTAPHGGQPPVRALETIRDPCMDCLPTVQLHQLAPSELWMQLIRHDDTCPTLKAHVVETLELPMDLLVPMIGGPYSQSVIYDNGPRIGVTVDGDWSVYQWETVYWEYLDWGAYLHVGPHGDLRPARALLEGCRRLILWLTGHLT